MKLNINLISPERKEQLKFIKKAHLALKIGFNSVFALLIFCAFLFFFRFSIQQQSNILQDEWNRLEKTEDYLLIERNKKLANDYNVYASKLEKNFSSNFFYWQILEKVEANLPEKTFLKELAVSEGQIIIKGRCASREDFLLFKEALEKEETFLEIKSPISNFTSSQNVEFEMTVQFKK